MAENPYTAEALMNDYHLGSAREAALIRAENGTDTMVCGQWATDGSGCGGTAWYKHTIGTHKCWTCGALWFATSRRWD